MQQISPENWVYIHYGLILSITAAQIVVVYLLRKSTHPPTGLTAYTIVLVASFGGWATLAVLHAQTVVYAVYSSAYALLTIVFLASVVIQYQRHLIALATEDPLTRLLNRRGLAEALNVSLATAARQGLSTSALMVDIDHFKKINDNFGHDTGDLVIQQIADVLQRMARASDIIARVGGEEYLLVLPDTELNAAQILAERIRAAIDEHTVLVNRQSIHTTVSLGVACMVGAVNLIELSEAADRALYLAKRGGRNRVASVEHKPVQMTTDTAQA
jgi:diguanylate cyclase (GGDEF)-like protein